MSIDLVTFEDAEWQLNDDVIEPDKIARLIERASGIILDHIDDRYPTEWIVADTSPAEYEIPQKIQQVTLVLISKMNQDRESGAIIDDFLYTQLYPYRTPTLSSPEED